MMASGVVTVSLWTNPHVFDVLPGMIVPLLVYAALVRLTKPEQTAPAE
jgi:hypothetical protein